MHVLIARIELHLPVAQSLKAKRSALVPILRHLDQQSGVAASEVDFHDKWQRAAIGMALVGATVSHLEQTLDAMERYLWSRPDVEVIEVATSWWDEE